MVSKPSVAKDDLEPLPAPPPPHSRSKITRQVHQSPCPTSRAVALTHTNHSSNIQQKPTVRNVTKFKDNLKIQTNQAYQKCSSQDLKIVKIMLPHSGQLICVFPLAYFHFCYKQNVQLLGYFFLSV